MPLHMGSRAHSLSIPCPSCIYSIFVLHCSCTIFVPLKNILGTYSEEWGFQECFQEILVRLICISWSGLPKTIANARIPTVNINFGGENVISVTWKVQYGKKMVHVLKLQDQLHVHVGTDWYSVLLPGDWMK